ncbi:NAD(P)H-binding protein [Pseudonocardia sp.]|uniref:NmrA family NAD(P)-binding protein n=1 Tax=Pseudonocardia sp. TaxID=60912 RepID=UPI003D0EDEA0
MSRSTSIVVFGATGTVGRHVLAGLAARGVAARGVSRSAPDPGATHTPSARVAHLTGPSAAAAIRADLDEPSSVKAAVAGADAVLLCTPNHPRQAEREIALIDLLEPGTRVVKVSAIAARAGSPSAFADAHGRSEAHLAASGLPATVLRAGFFTSNLLAGAETIRMHGRFFLPAGDAALPFTDPRDVAAVAVAALTGTGHEGRTYTVTGPVPLTCADAAAQLAAALGRPVEYVPVPDDVARAGMRDAGVPAWFADQIVLLYGELRRAGSAPATDVVRVLTGREPRTVADFARDHAAAFGLADLSS